MPEPLAKLIPAPGPVKAIPIPSAEQPWNMTQTMGDVQAEQEGKLITRPTRAASPEDGVARPDEHARTPDGRITRNNARKLSLSEPYPEYNK